MFQIAYFVILVPFRYLQMALFQRYKNVANIPVLSSDVLFSGEHGRNPFSATEPSSVIWWDVA